MAESQRAAEPAELPFTLLRFAWLGIPLTLKVAMALTPVVGAVTYASHKLISDAGSYARLEPGAALVLASLGGTTNTIGLALDVVSLVLLIASLPLLTRSRTEKRVIAKLEAMPGFLETAALKSVLLAARIRRSDEELQLYSGLESLKQEHTAKLLRMLEASGKQSTRATWIAAVVTLALSVVLALVLK